MEDGFYKSAMLFWLGSDTTLPDEDKAISLFRKSADEKNNPDACIALASILMLKMNGARAEAVRYLEKSVRLRSARGAVNLARVHEDLAKRDPDSFSMAKRLYLLALFLGDVTHMAAEHLADLHDAGKIHLRAKEKLTVATALLADFKGNPSNAVRGARFFSEAGVVGSCLKNGIGEEQNLWACGKDYAPVPRPEPFSPTRNRKHKRVAPFQPMEVKQG